MRSPAWRVPTSFRNPQACANIIWYSSRQIQWQCRSCCRGFDKQGKALDSFLLQHLPTFHRSCFKACSSDFQMEAYCCDKGKIAFGCRIFDSNAPHTRGEIHCLCIANGLTHDCPSATTAGMPFICCMLVTPRHADIIFGTPLPCFEVCSVMDRPSVLPSCWSA